MAPLPSHSQSQLPNPDVLILDCIEPKADRLRLMVHVEQDPACPLCGEVSRSPHSCYCQIFRGRASLFSCGRVVGRFRCRNSSCPRKIFCERLSRVARVYACQTDRASEIVRLIGYVAGGLPGQRLLGRLCIASGDDTVLRRVRQKPVPEVAVHPVRNLGVDWAWRKSQNHRTSLVNLDLHRVVDLLPDRAAESFWEWLRQFPEIATISRDRCGIYAEGATLGADRFHLVLNLSATMERVLGRWPKMARSC